VGGGLDPLCAVTTPLLACGESPVICHPVISMQHACMHACIYTNNPECTRVIDMIGEMIHTGYLETCVSSPGSHKCQYG
jgi:hypothetical protein